jgi:exopolysaccharide biosynthesis operon protein EpsL
MQRNRPLYPASILAVGISLVTAVSLSARADELDTFNIHLTEAYARDNNLFRLPDDVDPTTIAPDKTSRGDNIRTDSVSLTADKQYSLQRFHVGARLDNFAYSNYSYLDYTAKNFDGRWNWSLTPHITGLIAAERVQVLNSFADYQNYTRSIRTTDTVRANSEFGAIGALRFVAGVAQSKTTHSEPIQQEGNTRTRSAQAGLRYLSSAENTIGYWYRENRVDWIGRDLDEINLYDTRARQSDHEIYGTLNFAGQAAIEGGVIRVDRRHDNFDQRNYTGTGGRLTINWAPDVRIKIGFFAKRDYASWWSNTASYTVTDSFGVTPSWQITQKIALYGRIETSQREFLGPIVPTTADTRLDKLGSAQIGLNWDPVRNLTLGLSVQKNRRSSNQSGLDFSDTTTSGTAQLTF